MALSPRSRTARRFAPESKLPRAPKAHFGEFRLVVSFCERGGAPLSHFPPGQAGSEPEVRRHCFSRVFRWRRTAGTAAPTSGRHARSAVKMQTRAGTPTVQMTPSAQTAGTAWNADLRSARAVRRTAQRRNATCANRGDGQGTPTSGQFSRWGPARAVRRTAQRRIATRTEAFGRLFLTLRAVTLTAVLVRLFAG